MKIVLVDGLFRMAANGWISQDRLLLSATEL